MYRPALPVTILIRLHLVKIFIFADGLVHAFVCSTGAAAASALFGSQLRSGSSRTGIPNRWCHRCPCRRRKHSSRRFVGLFVRHRLELVEKRLQAFLIHLAGNGFASFLDDPGANLWGRGEPPPGSMPPRIIFWPFSSVRLWVRRRASLASASAICCSSVRCISGPCGAVFSKRAGGELVFSRRVALLYHTWVESGERRQHKRSEVRTYELLGSLALACATPVRGDCRPCDPASADPWRVGGSRSCRANQKHTTAAAWAARKRGAA